MIRVQTVLPFGCTLLLLFIGRLPAVEKPFDRWEPSISSFEKQDQDSFPDEGGVLFIGSSSIRMWNLEDSFPGKRYINRGFGGSEIADSIHFADRIVFPYKPSMIVMYAGDNDLSRKKDPEIVADDFATFIRLVRGRLRDTKVIFIAVKPSIARWELISEIRAANSLIEQQCQQHDDLEFVDIVAPMLGDNGRPRSDLFLKDGLHLNEKGYAIWTQLVADKIGAFSKNTIETKE